MSDHGLKVGDVCCDPARLRAGMTVKVRAHEEMCLPYSNAARFVVAEASRFHARDVESYEITSDHVTHHGVVILALPEEAPQRSLASGPAIREMHDLVTARTGGRHIVSAPLGPQVITQPAAPSLDAVPVGSRWRNNNNGIAFTVTSPTSVRTDDGVVDSNASLSLAMVPSFATRIDEPAGAGKVESCDYSWLDHDGETLQCKLQRGHGGAIHDSNPCDKSPAAKPAMPPDGCAPGCVPAKPCRIVIPVTDKGTRYECPAFAEERVKPGAMVLDYVDSQARDRYEARAMRDQRWEAMNAGPMVGRYRFNRR